MPVTRTFHFQPYALPSQTYISVAPTVINILTVYATYALCVSNKGKLERDGPKRREHEESLARKGSSGVSY